jgi:hypothetical protein
MERIPDPFAEDISPQDYGIGGENSGNKVKISEPAGAEKVKKERGDKKWNEENSRIELDGAIKELSELSLRIFLPYRKWRELNGKRYVYTHIFREALMILRNRNLSPSPAKSSGSNLNADLDLLEIRIPSLTSRTEKHDNIGILNPFSEDIHSLLRKFLYTLSGAFEKCRKTADITNVTKILSDGICREIDAKLDTVWGLYMERIKWKQRGQHEQVQLTSPDIIKS